MNDLDIANDSEEAPVSLEQVEELLGERLDVEALAQMVEHLDYADKLSKKLSSAFGDVRAQVGRQGNALGAVQQEIRDLVLDVSLLKRALASLGHVGGSVSTKESDGRVPEESPACRSRRCQSLTFPVLRAPAVGAAAQAKDVTAKPRRPRQPTQASPGLIQRRVAPPLLRRERDLPRASPFRL